MPVTKQAKKRMRSDTRKQKQNVGVLSKLKNLKKKFKTIENKEEATKQARILSQAFDKAQSKGTIPKKRASRIKSRTAKRLAKM